MAQLNIRIDDETRDLVDALARAKGLNTSDLLREIIAQALGRDEENPKDDLTPQSLSVVKRHELALQHAILAQLTSQDENVSADHREVVEILERGYTAEYHKVFDSYYSELTKRNTDLAHDILEMFTQIEWSISKLSEGDLLSLGFQNSVLEFQGFDFNDSLEIKLALYARFIISNGAYPELAKYFEPKRGGGNSHARMLAKYQAMVSVAKPLWNKRVKQGGIRTKKLLTIDDLQQIRDAQNYFRTN